MREGRREWLDRRKMKAKAKVRLRGRLGPCFVACILPMLLPWVIRLVPSNIGVKYLLLADLYVVGVSVPMTALSFVATIFVTDVMNVRLAGYFLKMHEGLKAVPPGTICDCFGEDYWPNMRAMLLRTAYIGAFTLPFIAASLLAPGAVRRETVEGLDCLCLNPSPVMMLLAMAGYLYAHVSSLLTRYIAASDAGASAREALRRSRRLVHGRFWEIAMLELTFLPWVLAASTLLFPSLYAYPYMESTFAEYYREMTLPTPTEEHLDGGAEDDDAAR